MGYQSTVIVLNDSLNAIRHDKNFGNKLHDAIVRVCCISIGAVDIAAEGNGITHCNAATVIETHHADNTTVIASGGNCGQVVGNAGGRNFNMNKDEDKVRLLKQLAGDLGYNLHRQPKRA